MSPAAPLGQFLELAIPTDDIVASVQFYERLGFGQRLTGDAWPHRYGVLGDGRIHLGLHERTAQTAFTLEDPTPCFVHPGLLRHVESLRHIGLEPHDTRFGDESLHHLWLRDPGGHALLLQEARSFSPPDGAAADGDAAGRTHSLCGYFLQLSLPEPDFEAALEFWERAGFVGMPDEALPYAHRPLISDQLNLAFHAPRSGDTALLVFELSDEDVDAVSARLRSLGVQPLARPPRALQRQGSLMLEAPEGTRLLLVPAQSGR